MTDEEAREILAMYKFKLTQSISNQLEGDIEAFDMAIKALDQQPMHGYKIDWFTPTAQAWLSTFNTNSATECFTAVQELKKRLEGDTDATKN